MNKFDLGHSIFYKTACATSEHADQPVHPRILSRHSTVRLKKVCCLATHRLQSND